MHVVFTHRTSRINLYVYISMTIFRHWPYLRIIKFYSCRFEVFCVSKDSANALCNVNDINQRNAIFAFQLLVFKPLTREIAAELYVSRNIMICYSVISILMERNVYSYISRKIILYVHNCDNSEYLIIFCINIASCDIRAYRSAYHKFA